MGREQCWVSDRPLTCRTVLPQTSGMDGKLSSGQRELGAI